MIWLIISRVESDKHEIKELEEFYGVDETDVQGSGGDMARSMASLEKWGWIMFECGIENLIVKGNITSSTTYIVQ